MDNLKYTLIKNSAQYNDYCDKLEDLLTKDESKFQDEIDLLNLLIEKWDNEHNTFNDSDPIQILKMLMDEQELKSKDLVEILDLSKGTVSKILN